MAKLSTQQLRTRLIQHYTQDAAVAELVASQMDAELVRQFGQVLPAERVNILLTNARRTPNEMITYYFFSKNDAWLREQHRSLAQPA